jgi:hypothetical protein
VDKTTPYYNQFSITGKTIKYIGNNQSWHQILMSEVIPKDKGYSFKIKVINTQYSYIMLGIVDRLAGKNNQYSQGKEYAIYYYCYDGYVYPSNLGIKGVKINSGETMEVVVDLSKGKVEFKVSNVTKATVN